jgi:hypothetical protein
MHTDKIKQKVKYDDGTIIQQVQIIPDDYSKLREYISNSTDSAEDFYDPARGEYAKDIVIEIVKIKGKNKKERKIVIRDNCSGMSINPNETLTIFRSDKLTNRKYSGRFGMGRFEGLGLCNNIHYETKQSSSNVIFSFDITPDIFTTGGENSMEIEINYITTDISNKDSGTIVTLSDFLPGVFEDIDFKVLKEKIENDLEQILIRKGITILLKEDNNQTVKCEPFDYRKYCSTPYEKTIDTLYLTNSKKFKTKKEISIKKTPIRLSIFASENTNLNKGIYLSSHGHKVTDLIKSEQFRSNNKSILSRPNVGGFIDVTEVLIPTPTRKEFMKTKLSKAFFHTLSMLEPEIISYIESVTKPSVNGKLQLLENKINSVLQGFEENLTEDNTEVENNKASGCKEYTLLGYKIRESEKTESLAKAEKDKPSNVQQTGRIRQERERNHKFTVKYPSQKSNQGLLTLRIDTINEPFKDISGNDLRSVVRDSKIIVFQKHPEFQKRLTQSLKGFFEINDKIVHFLAMEIITQIKAIKNESDNTKPENIHEDFVTSVLKLEEDLKSLVGERI